jgi:hypothetical protein
MCLDIRARLEYLWPWAFDYGARDDNQAAAALKPTSPFSTDRFVGVYASTHRQNSSGSASLQQYVLGRLPEVSGRLCAADGQHFEIVKELVQN